MTLEQIKEERQMLEGQIELAVAQFKKRCGLEDWQVIAQWGPTTVSINDGPGRNVYQATVSVKV